MKLEQFIKTFQKFVSDSSFTVSWFVDKDIVIHEIETDDVVFSTSNTNDYYYLLNKKTDKLFKISKLALA